MLNPIVQPGKFTEMDQFIFESWGYFIIPNVLAKDEIAEALAASARLHDEAGTKEFGQVGRGYETEPALEALIDHPAVLPKIRGILGEHFILQALWNTKQPARGKTGGWHQDGSSAYDFKHLGSPVPLIQLRASFLLNDQHEPGMGNMEMIPGSHRSRVGPPREVLINKGDTPISHIVCAHAGDVLVFHNAVWHRPYEHNHDYDRYTAHYIYSPPWVRASDRFTTDKDFYARTTEVRRSLMGEFDRPDAPYGVGYKAPDFPEDNE
ncbi:phytanoyl-CoA dioxygenase family protein [Paenibacillus spongiae]|uniref:Phytanoyl-CoA dioxygenase family protein n=1 Tax=Paenibacillus spongiae TaxID=2909671 RepID=A0ABY5SL22_9BACL|nr:phytanoyl-CoA dioxygenase family protein [Paenibacillus spongiae]UVI33355.1 phytanoyl-CoA dioxygenase family protein [Paenibacillus spongiae]